MPRPSTLLAAGALTAAFVGAVASGVGGTAFTPKRAWAPDVTVAGACPVTAPNGSTPLGERRSPQHHGGGLWTVLPRSGRLVVVPSGLPPGDHVAVDRIEPDGSIAIKFPWWGSAAAGDRLTITGRRLDRPARPLRASVLDGSTGTPHFWATRVIFPRAGCWEITGRSGTTTLTFVLSFVDQVTDRSARSRSRPTPGSRGCRVTRPNHREPPYGAPVETNHGVAGLSTVLPHRGVIVAVRPGRRLTPDTVVVHERPSADGSLPVSFPWVRSGRRHVRISGRRLDAPGSLRAATRHITYTSTRVRFPSAGCWRLTARFGAARMSFVVFVIDELRTAG